MFYKTKTTISVCTNRRKNFDDLKKKVRVQFSPLSSFWFIWVYCGADLHRRIVLSLGFYKGYTRYGTGRDIL